jgi:hypothetical protein
MFERAREDGRPKGRGPARYPGGKEKVDRPDSGAA